MSFNLSQTFYWTWKKYRYTMRYRILWNNPLLWGCDSSGHQELLHVHRKRKDPQAKRSSMNQKFSNTTGSKRVRSGKVARVRPLFSFTFTKTVSKQDVQEPVHCEIHPISCACCATFSPVSNETGMWKCSVCLVWIYCPSANQAFPTSLSSSCAPSIHARGRFHTFLSCHARHPGGHDLVSLKFQAFTTKKFLVLPYSSQSLEDLQPKVMGNYTHYLIYAASYLAEQTYPLALLIDDTDASVSSIHFYGQAGSSHRFLFFFGGVGGGKWTWIVEELVLLLLVFANKRNSCWGVWDRMIWWPNFWVDFRVWSRGCVFVEDKTYATQCFQSFLHLLLQRPYCQVPFQTSNWRL